MSSYLPNAVELVPPDPVWAGQDVFLIGGGPSLRGFDWSLLRGKNTIGCNAAFTLGVDVCKVCFFSDWKWYVKFEDDLKAYADQGGRVFTHLRTMINRKRLHGLPHIEIMAREKTGLHHDALGFGGNSGCSATNLALVLGAARVFLLGFDCKVDQPGDTHWHNLRIDIPLPHFYTRYMQGWKDIHFDLPVKFPGREIINLNPDSAIPFFPKAVPADFLHAQNYAHAC